MKKIWLFATLAVVVLSCSEEFENITPETTPDTGSELKATAKRSGKFDRIRKSTYHINNNVWGHNKRGAGKQDLWVTSMNSWGVNAKHKKGDGTIKAYPCILIGDHWNDGPSKSPFPRKIKDLGRVTTHWKQTNSGKSYNCAYDIWFDAKKKPGNTNAGFELMIWTNWKGMNPIAHGYNTRGALARAKKVKIGPHLYNVYYKKNSHQGIDVMSFLCVNKTNNYKADLKPIIDYCVKNKWLKREHYLTSVQAGWEIVEGGKFETTKFRLYNVK